MGRLNRVMLIGRTTGNAEFRWIEEHRGATRFALEVARTYRDHEGVERTASTTIPVVAYGDLAGRCKDLRADTADVYVEGRLKLEQWKGDDGTMRSMYSVVADRCEFTGAAAPAVPAKAPPALAAAGDERPPGRVADPRRASRAAPVLAGTGA